MRQTVTIPIGTVQPADSPRLAGEDPAHVRVLAEAGTALPAIVVHRNTMRVVDGMHRLRALELIGADTIEVEFFDGTPENAFVFAVRTNIAHGLPLPLADREAAAVRIVGTHPQWTNRAIAEITGLTPKKLAKIRQTVTTESPQADPVRPINAGGRPRAKRMPAYPFNQVDQSAILRTLSRDPSLRLTESGRVLLRALSVMVADAHDLGRFAGTIPSHCTTLVADLIDSCVGAWETFAGDLRS